MTTITIPDELAASLRARAAKRRVTFETLVRETLERAADEPIRDLEPRAEEQVDSASQEDNSPKPRRTFKSAGLFDSGFTDTAQMASDHTIFEPRSWRS
jgi:hypothetical protein